MALAVLAPGVMAQSTGSVLGRVSGEAGEAGLANAVVSIPGTGLSVLSGDEGWYFLADVPVGRREITVALPGFAVARRAIDVGPGDALVLNFQLGADPLSMDELVISTQARIPGAPANWIVIGPEEIAKRRANTVTQILQGLVPGLTQTVTSGDVGSAAQIRIRGARSFEGSPPLFFVDGIRIGSSNTGGPVGTGGVLTFLDNINPRDIDRIEILHAAEATTLFGTDAVGGAILIYTKR
jgi:outer membrane receptor protein involved in Fe transport